MRGRAWLAALLLAAGAAAAQPAKEVDVLPPYPRHVGAWRLDQVTDYESRPNGAGLGSGANYRPVDESPGLASIFLYDRGRRGLADGAETPEATAELALAIRDVEGLAQQRRYRIAARAPAPPVPGVDGRPALRCEALTLALETGTSQASIACVGVRDGRFVKLRLTRPAEAPGDAAAMARDIGQAMLGAGITAGRSAPAR